MAYIALLLFDINDNLSQQMMSLFKHYFINNPLADTWQRGTFSDIIQSTIGGDWGKDSLSGNYTEEVFCIRGADIPDVKAGDKGKMPIRFILPKNYSSKKLQANDLVVEISGGSPTQSTGRIAFISQSLLDRYHNKIVCTNFCRAIKPKNCYALFLYVYWQYLYDIGLYFTYENGTTGIKNFDLIGFISTEEIVLPPDDLLSKFTTICSGYLDKINANGMENERLSAIRDNLLPKLMVGELDVADIQID